MPRPDYPPIADPSPDLESVYTVVQQLKQTIEIVTGQRAPHTSISAVTWQDLVDLGLIEPGQVPQNRR